jgi:hypothetical protein
MAPPLGSDFEAYDALPEVIRGHITRKEYAWLSDEQKQNLVEDMTTPEDPEPLLE